MFCEPLVFTRVVNLHSALRYTEAPHHGSRAAGGWSAAASHKSTRKPETSVTPNAPMLNTHTAQPQPVQNRADHGLATNPTDPIDLSASSGSFELTQVECLFPFTIWSLPLKCEMHIFCVAEGFSLCRVAVSMSECYSHHVLLPVPVCVHVPVSMCVCAYIFPVVQTWVLDVTDEPARLCGAGCSFPTDAQWFV